MNSMGMAKYTMITLFLLKGLLITLTLIFLTIFGFIMKEPWFLTLRKEEGRSSLQMGRFSKEIFTLTEFKVSVNTTLMMETSSKVFGESLSL
jgi:hypothetical protein